MTKKTKNATSEQWNMLETVEALLVATRAGAPLWHREKSAPGFWLFAPPPVGVLVLLQGDATDPKLEVYEWAPKLLGSCSSETSDATDILQQLYILVEQTTP